MPVKFSDLSLSTKQVVASVLILLLMAGVTLFSIYQMASLKDGIVELANFQASADVVESADHTYRKAIKIIVLLLGFTTAVSLGIAVLIAGYVTEPLNRLVDAARRVADGDLTVELPVTSGDEVGSLTTSFNDMAVALRAAEEENQRQAVLLATQEKMASLGNLVAGVAHEINTPIGAVNSAAQVSERALEMIAEALEKADDLEALKTNKRFNRAVETLLKNAALTSTAGKRVADIVKSLREFSTLDEADFQRVDVHGGLDSTLDLIGHRFEDRIEVVKNYGELPSIVCYPNQLNQVFMNVLSNAVEAIEGKGTITITTSQEGDNVHVAIADDGCGIDDETLPRIYDPGFTTKAGGVGLGLGLSTSHNIVAKHAGRIEVATAFGEGTTMVIVLPVEPANA